MTKPSRALSTHKKWMILFGLWLVLLSGALANFVGSPGILQSVRLSKLLESKKEQLRSIQDDLRKLHQEKAQLETNRFTQEREVRRVLGYAAHDEIIFDFTPSGQY